MTGPAIEFVDVRFAYPHAPAALAGVNLAVGRGEKVALVGPNGAGKTTLILMCNGMLRPTRGDVRIDGVPIDYSARGLRSVRSRVGIVFQNSDNQVFAPTVYQDVAFGPMNLGLPQESVRQRVADALHAVGLVGCERRPPHHLSGGEKKRVAIAGILAMGPEVLILDEPTGSLDPATAEEIVDLLDELQAAGTTILLSTHDVELAHRWADEVCLMHEGRVLRQAPPGEIFADQALVRRARLKPPAVIELYGELVLRGIVERGIPPKSILEFTDLVERRRKERIVQDALGTIYVCDADAAAGDALRSLIDGASVEYVGAMGTRAKKFANRELILLDFTYGVIDKCILKALVGENSLILTTGGMVDHVFQRIREYGIESSRPLVARPLTGTPQSTPPEDCSLRNGIKDED
jgi:cobalt/nickel transport system ATP-binding protein